MAMAGMVCPALVFELDNSCQCEGCCRKISKVMERLEGVCEYELENDRLVLKGRNVDPSNVIRRLSKVKKHVRFVGVSFPNHQIPPPPPAEQPPPCTADHHCLSRTMLHNPVHACCTNEPLPPIPAPACHCPHAHPPSQGRGQVHVHFNELPPPSSASHCPPPHHQHCAPRHECNHLHALHHHQFVNDAPDAELENFMHRPGSPLIPRNVSPAEVLGQLGNMENLKQVDLIYKKGIKLTFDDGRVTSWHPVYSMGLCPGFVRDPQHLPPRYVSPFSDENPNALCSIM